MFTSDELKTELKNRKVKIHKDMTAPVGMVNRGQTVIEARSKLLGNDTVEDLANWIA